MSAPPRCTHVTLYQTHTSRRVKKLPVGKWTFCYLCWNLISIEFFFCWTRRRRKHFQSSRTICVTRSTVPYMSLYVQVCACVCDGLYRDRRKKKRENRIDKNVERERERWKQVVVVESSTFKKRKRNTNRKKNKWNKEEEEECKRKKKRAETLQTNFFHNIFSRVFFFFFFYNNNNNNDKTHTQHLITSLLLVATQTIVFHPLFVLHTTLNDGVCVCVCDGVGSGLFIANGYDHIRLRRARFSAAAVDSIVQQTGSFFFCERLAIDDRPTPQ